jgi:hypothetical protein
VQPVGCIPALLPIIFEGRYSAIGTRTPNPNLRKRTRMKFSMYVVKDAIQFNLSPETDIEKEYLNLLNKYTGQVVISKGVDLALCRGKYIRSFGESKDHEVAITIYRPEVKPEDFEGITPGPQ